MNMQEEDSNAGSDIGHEDLADVASFDADADVLPDNSNRKVPSPKHSKGASSATTRQSRIQEVTSHRSTAQAAHEPRQKSKLRNSLRSSIKSTGSKAKNQADELRKGAMVNRASVSRNRKMSEKRQDSFISATRILERTASDLQMVRDELQHQKKKVSLTMVKEEIVMDFLTLNFSNEKLEISYRRKVFNDLRQWLEYALYPTTVFGLVICLYEAFYCQSLAGTIVAIVGLITMYIAVMGPEIFPDLVEYLRNEDDDDDVIQRQTLDYRRATDFNIAAVILATTLLTVAIALGRGEKYNADLKLISTTNCSSAVVHKPSAPFMLSMGDTIIIPCTFMAFSTLTPIPCLQLSMLHLYSTFLALAIYIYSCTVTGETFANMLYVSSAALLLWWSTNLFRRWSTMEMRQGFQLAKRLAVDNVHVAMELQAQSWFRRQSVTGATPSGRVIPGGTLSGSTANTGGMRGSRIRALRCQIEALDLTIGKPLGAGSFGEVKMGNWKETDVAVKVLGASFDQQEMIAFGNEAGLMADLRHPNIVMFIGISIIPPMLVMEYMSRGTLYSSINYVSKEGQSNEWFFESSVVLRIIRDVARGMHYLHTQKRPVLHLDLKSPNVLLSDEFRGKVADFGLSTLKSLLTAKRKQLLKDQGKEVKHEVGSVAWTAPECFRNSGIMEEKTRMKFVEEHGDEAMNMCGSSLDSVTEKADVYSFGVIIFELEYRQPPYRALNPHAIPFAVVRGERPVDHFCDTPHLREQRKAGPLPAYSKQFRNLMKKCLDDNPKARPSFKEILSAINDIGAKTIAEDWAEKRVVGPEQFATEAKLHNEIKRISSQQQVKKGFKIDPKHVIMGKRIGKGSYATVYKGTYQGTPVAIKKFLIGSVPKEVIEDFEKETEIVEKLRHPNIVLYMGCAETLKPKHTLLIVTELMSKGSLFDLYHKIPKPKNHTDFMLKCLLDICHGICYLHSHEPNPIIHRDLKSENILMDSNGNSKLADFGFSRVVDSTVTMTRCGSPLWIAPEIVRGEKFNESSDVFSFSVVVWEILAWQEPYPGEDPTVVMAKVAQFSYRPKRDPSWPKILNTLMKRCWAKDPKARPSFPMIRDELLSLQARSDRYDLPKGV